MRLVSVIALSLGLIAGAASAQDYPAKPVTIITPNAAGGATDSIARFYAEELGKELGQSFVIENVPGGGATIGAGRAARAAPDGYTILMGNGASNALNMLMFKNPGYDAKADFVPLGMLARVAMAIAVPAESGIKDLRELVQKSQTERVNIALPSTMARLINAYLTTNGGSKLNMVPFSGTPDAMAGILGGHVQATIETAVAVKPMILDNKLRVVGVTTQTPSTVLPSAPTVASQGFPEFEMIGWFMFFAPEGTPAPIVEKINAALTKIQSKPETKEKLMSLGYEFAETGTPASLEAFIDSELKKFEPVVVAADLFKKN